MPTLYEERTRSRSGGDIKWKAAYSQVYTPLVKLALNPPAMNDLVHSCNAAPTYPKNLISSGEYQHTLQNYVRQLDEHDTQLFDVEDQAALDFWELHDGLASTSSQLAT